MRSLQEEVVVRLAGREKTSSIDQVRKGPGHVERSPDRDPVSEIPGQVPRVIGEVACEIAVGPSTAIFQGLRQVPMIERAEWTNAGLQKRIHQTAVVIQAFLVDSSCACRLNSGPRRRGWVAVLVRGLENCNGLAVEVVLITRNVSRSATFDSAGSV